MILVDTLTSIQRLMRQFDNTGRAVLYLEIFREYLYREFELCLIIKKTNIRLCPEV